ncbi:MAG: dynamin family protein, partial [Pseudomonadota bacterium]
MSGATAEAPRDLPTVVVMGEFSAGKSSLINLLLGEQLMPTQITATQSPAYLLGYGSDPRILAVRRDGGIEEVQTTDPMTLDYRRYEVVRLRRPAPVLKRLMIIDTPGISDPLLPAHALADFADTADMVLWCTLATQAWRESEQSFWREMPSRLKRSSTLVVTKTDLLRAGDLDRLQTRLAAET